MTDLIKAKDAIEGETYLLVLSPSSIYRLKIVTKHEGSVSVQDERYTSVNSISNETVLTPYNEEYYNKHKKPSVQKEKDQKESEIPKKEIKSNKKAKGVTEMRTTNPRSVIIDKYLKETLEGEKPNFPEIGVKVLQELGSEDVELKAKIISQARIRYYAMNKRKETV